MPEQTITKENEIELLLEIANKGLKNSRSDGSSMQNRLQVNLSELSASPLLKDYTLEDKDIKIIAVLFKKFLDGKEDMKAFDIIKSVEKDKKIALMEIKRLSRLTKSGILEVGGNRSENTDGIGLIHSNLRLSDKFLDRLYKFDDKKERTLSPEKLLLVLKEVVRLNVTQEEPDDIDHLGNRRVRAVGELAQNRFRIGLARMERIIKDRMSTYELEGLSPNKLVNARPVIGAVREFFMSSQLSQFMDQINPLAELEHKRRVSALGPGGLSRDRAGFEVRDVHTTHYSRICPIATPEGPNIGLVGHLASYARVNEFGFLEAPYRKVTKETAKDGTIKSKVTSEVAYLNSFAEERVITASAITPVDSEGYLIPGRVPARVHGEPTIAETVEIDYLDVASNQILSIATSLIPFLEHDDATRALMGTNMQRQAVPCITPEAPLVGTGIERLAAANSGHVLFAEADGEITAVSGGKIELTTKKGEVKIYPVSIYNPDYVINYEHKIPHADGFIDESGEAQLSAGFYLYTPK